MSGISDKEKKIKKYNKSPKWFEAKKTNNLNRRRQGIGLPPIEKEENKRSCGLVGNLPETIWLPNGSNCFACGRSIYAHPPLYTMIPIITDPVYGSLCPFKKIEK